MRMIILVGVLICIGGRGRILGFIGRSRVLCFQVVVMLAWKLYGMAALTICSILEFGFAWDKGVDARY
jgi:hypothetical protein